MSFTFNWPRFSDQFHYDAIQMLNTALNKGNKPPIIADKIEVVELEMGTQVVLLPTPTRLFVLIQSTAPRTRNSRYRRPHRRPVQRHFSSDVQR